MTACQVCGGGWIAGWGEADVIEAGGVLAGRGGRQVVRGGTGRSAASRASAACWLGAETAPMGAPAEVRQNRRTNLK